MTPVLLNTASILTGLRGIAHPTTTRGVVRGFGDLSEDKRRIITMEGIFERGALIPTASFVSAATAVDPKAPVPSAVYGVAVGTLLVLAVVSLSLFTGFKVALLPFRLCPMIFGVVGRTDRLGAWG